jgi:hypothetical protein
MSLLEFKMAKVAHISSVEEITVVMMETFDFGWIGSFGCLLQSPKIVDVIVSGIAGIAIPWWCKQTNRFMGKASRQRAKKRNMKILSHK